MLTNKNYRANTSSFIEIVNRRFSNELASFRGSLGKSNIYESHTNTTDHISVSYKGRTLIELIQNGYDPHPADQTDGEISILLDVTETDHGCLYVANRGHGFTQKNFDGICDMARSPKVVNQGIGNKGLGFRGVLQICQNPEIYSQDGKGAPADDFHGFRFTFPTDALLAEKLSASEHADIQDEIITTVPRPLLPIALTHSPQRVREFADKGFATVIRMPLGRADAAEELKTQINQICDYDVPLHVFLERLESIKVEIIDDESEDEPEPFAQLLKRSVKRQWSTNELTLQHIDIDENCSFLVAKKFLPESEFRPRLEEGIASGQLPDAWAKWQGDAEICIAVETTRNNEIGRLYNFLPMDSSANSPFAGHVNAPFLCDIDRTTLVENVDLNDYFLDEVAGLCLTTVTSLKDDLPELARAVAIDLAIWTDDYWERIGDAATRLFEASIDQIPIIPTCIGSAKHPWACISDLDGWPDFEKDLPILSRQTLGSIAQLNFPAEEIGSDGLERLEGLAWNLCEIDLGPDYEQVAIWVTKLAAKLSSEGAPVSSWDQYYQDVSEAFADNPKYLCGAPILRTENKELAETLGDAQDGDDDEPKKDRRQKNHAVFLPSTRQSSVSEAEEELEDDEEDNLFRQIPPSLSGSIQLISSELKLTRRKGPTKARAFLLDNGLVNSFRREDLQRVLANLTSNPGPGKNSEKRRFDALRLSFDLSEGGVRTAELAEMPFHVPSRKRSWIPARSAYFSGEWPKTQGGQLERLIEIGGPHSGELAALEDSLLQGLEAWPRKGRAQEWVKFLRKLGVSDTLPVFNARPRGSFKHQGYLLKGNLLEKCVTSESIHDFWEDDLPADILNPYTYYTVRGMVPMITGLNDYRSFPTNVRHYFAIELIRTLIEHGRSLLEITIYRPDHRWQDNQTNWKSPIASILRHENWLPSSASDSREHFCKPSDIWHAPRHGAFEHASFLPIVTGKCRDLLDTSAPTQELLQEFSDLKIVGSLSSAAAQVSELGHLAYEGKIQRSDIAIFDKTYAEGWQLLASDSEVLTETIETAGLYIAAHVEDDVHGFSLKDDEQSSNEEKPGLSSPIYIADDIRPTTRDLLKEMGKPLFDFKFESRGTVAADLCHLYPRLQRVSEVALSIYVDGELHAPSADHDYLVSPERRWLQDAIVVICDLSSAFMTLGNAALDTLRARLAKVRFSLVERIEIDIDGERRPLPDFLQSSLLINDADGPLLLIESAENDLTWEILRQAAHSIAEGLGWPNQLESVLSSAFSQLAAIQGPGELTEPTEADYQAICRKGKQTVREAVRGLRHITEVLIEALRPVLLVSTDTPTYKRISEDLVHTKNEDEIADMLARHQSDIQIDVDEILDACRRNDSLDGIRCALKIELGKYNDALQGLGPPYMLLDFGEDQRIAFRSFVKRHETNILNCLRETYATAFDQYRPLEGYINARNMDELDAASEWSTIYDDVPESLLIKRIDAWLESKGVPALAEAEPLNGLEAIECREQNRKFLSKLVKDSWPILNAWCNKNQVELPDVWRVQNDAPQLVTQLASNQGWLDFRLLDQADAIKRLHLDDAWPSSMPVSLDVAELSIASEELDASRQEEITRQLERQRQANTIVVGDHELSARQADLPETLDSIASLYDANEELWKGSARVVRMSPMETPRHGGSGKGGKGSSKGGRPNRIPQGQKDAIGLLGEKLGFKWLKTHYPDLVDEKCWVSGNREIALQAEPGDDSLGYDFKVNHPSYVGFYEVKATSGDAPFFRMGPTEVEHAVKCRKDAKYRYRVLFIRNVTDPDNMTIQLLPNPFSAKDKTKFRVVTKGEVGLSFNLT